MGYERENFGGGKFSTETPAWKKYGKKMMCEKRCYRKIIFMRFPFSSPRSNKHLKIFIKFLFRHKSRVRIANLYARARTRSIYEKGEWERYVMKLLLMNVHDPGWIPKIHKGNFFDDILCEQRRSIAITYVVFHDTWMWPCVAVFVCHNVICYKLGTGWYIFWKVECSAYVFCGE